MGVRTPRQRWRPSTIVVGTRMLPSVLSEVDQLAERLRVTRSELVLQAVEALLEHHKHVR